MKAGPIGGMRAVEPNQMLAIGNPFGVGQTVTEEVKGDQVLLRVWSGGGSNYLVVEGRTAKTLKERS